MEDNVKVGDIVLSLAGRDAKRCFVVIGKEGNFVYLCNGKLRGCLKPKKKKIKHIKELGRVSEAAAEKLERGEILTDKEFKAELRVFCEAEAEKI